MTVRLAVLVLLIGPVVVLSASTQSRQTPLDAAHAFLASQFRFGVNEFRDLARRQAVARTLETVDGREVATIGAVAIAASAAFYADQLRGIVSFKRESPAVKQIGVFSTPATTEDAAALSLDSGEAATLRRCRPRDCDVQLSGEAIARVTRALEGRAADAAAAERVMREVLVDLVNDYRARGDGSLMTYVDADKPVSVADEFRAMIASRPAVLERFPDLYRHVAEFPRPSSTPADDVVYWSKEKMGPAVIVSVTHLAIMRLNDLPFEAFAAASKQIYGSHYFDSSLGITLLLDATVEDRPQTILVYVNRSRLDALRGFLGGMKRAIVRSRTRSSMSGSLVDARDLVERRFRASTASAR